MSEYQIDNRSGGDWPAKQDDLIELAKILHDVINEFLSCDSKVDDNLRLLQESLKEIIGNE